MPMLPRDSVLLLTLLAACSDDAAPPSRDAGSIADARIGDAAAPDGGPGETARATAGRYWAELIGPDLETSDATTVWFEYRTTTDAWDNAARTIEADVPAGSLLSEVHGFAIGLAPDTDYAWRLCSRAAGAEKCETESTFRTRAPATLPRIRVDPDDPRELAREDGSRFVVWGNNFVSVTNDDRYGLVERAMYLETGLAEIDADLGRLTNLAPPDGQTNAIRMHLQLHTFLRDASTPNEEAFARYARVVELAEDRGLYVMVTGLNYFYPADNPLWIAMQSESDHWASQALWWETMSKSLAHSPGAFAYDLMNEPYVGGDNVAGAITRWTTVAPTEYCDYGGDPDRGIHGTCFGQYVSAGVGGRTADEIATSWTRAMVEAIRRGETASGRHHLVTIGVGAFGLSNVFNSSTNVHAELDFLSPHLYPADGSADEPLAIAAGIRALSDKPIIAGETFTFGPADVLIRDACNARTVQGWFGQYDGRRRGDPCPPERDVFGCALFDAWYTIQADFGPEIRAGMCPAPE